MRTVEQEPRENVVMVRVSVSEKIRIQEYAAEMGLSVAEYGRRAMLRSPRGRPFALLERALIQGIRDKDLGAVKKTLADILVFLEDLKRT